MLDAQTLVHKNADRKDHVASGVLKHVALEFVVCSSINDHKHLKYSSALAKASESHIPHYQATAVGQLWRISVCMRDTGCTITKRTAC